MANQDYELQRQKYKPLKIKWLFIAESPPPAAATTSTRHFYRPDVGIGGLFSNTIKALYNSASSASEAELADHKQDWLQKFQADGCYMIEALDQSLPHGTTTSVRRQEIKNQLPQLLEKVKTLANSTTKIILIKSNPYNIAAEPLKQAGYHVLNKSLLDYPGYWREDAYRTKLKALLKQNGWQVSDN